MENGAVKVIIAVVIGFMILRTCNFSGSNRSNNTSRTSKLDNWQKSPLDDVIKSLSDERNFSILLYDMDANDPTLGAAAYKHKYRIVIEKPDTVLSRDTEWYTVSDVFFQQHVNDMGMEIASKKDGVVKKQVAPAGYNNYVGNTRYGRWTQRNGTSFWEFYGQYAFMRSMFNLMAYPARRSYWDDYRGGGYYGSGRSYYGPGGRKIYGTQTYTASASGKNSTWGAKPSTFKTKVRNSVSRSTANNRSRSYSSSSSYSNRTSRSSSRSSSSSSYRSRSGGFGK